MQLDDDDRPIGRVLSRRDAVRLLAVSSAAVVVGCRPRGQAGVAETSAVAASTRAASANAAAATTLPRCVAKPELTVGPYFVDAKLDRADVRVEPSTGAAKPGEPLVLTFNVKQIANGQCTPLPNAMVDIWQCDAMGQYSGVNDRMVGFNTETQKFLRGYQVTDGNGVARFTTIYPGWYQGRAVHIHFKIRTPADAALKDQQAYEFTSQLFFDDALSDQVHKGPAYASKGQRSTRERNQNDGIYRQGGDVLLLSTALAPDGYHADFDVGLDLSDAATGRPERSGGPGGGRPPGGRPPRPPV
jgi:protocatechuate 3,4-dioxygenase beta subunit